MLWTELRSDEFNDAVEKCNKVCVIPIGCVEAHSIHLPLGCDTIKGLEFCRRASEIEPVCVFPAMYFGEKSGAGEYPGTIIFPTTLIWQILEQSCYEIARNGFKKIVIVGSHGGNTAMLNAFTRQMLQKNPDFLVYYYYQPLAKPAEILADIEKYPYLTEEDIKVIRDFVDQGKIDGHGGFVETGSLYDICPELVRLDLMDKRDGTSTKLFAEFDEHKIYTPFGWMGNYPNSYTGDMHYGLNERIARALGEYTVCETAKVFKFIREETTSLEYHKEWLAKQTMPTSR